MTSKLVDNKSWQLADLENNIFINLIAYDFVSYYQMNRDRLDSLFIASGEVSTAQQDTVVFKDWFEQVFSFQLNVNNKQQFIYGFVNAITASDKYNGIIHLNHLPLIAETRGVYAEACTMAIAAGKTMNKKIAFAYEDFRTR